MMGMLREKITFEVLVAVLLAMATVFSAWCVYEANIWNGIQSIEFGNANILRSESVRMSNVAGVNLSVDVTIFLEWIDAKSSNDTLRSSFLESRFRKEFLPAFQAWLETTERSPDTNIPMDTPFILPEYVLSSRQESELLSQNASLAFERGLVANKISDSYILVTVFFALVLFLGSTSTKWSEARVKKGMLLMALAIFTTAVLYMLSLPVDYGFYWIFGR